MALAELLAPYRDCLSFPAVIGDRSTDDASHTYFALTLCESGNTRSDYIVDGAAGYFRENVCGAKNSGKLERSEELTVSDPLFGPVTGWVYNARKARKPCAFLLSSAEVAPDTFPGMYLVIKGAVHTEGTSFEFDPSGIYVAQRG